jgi:hypothetical protein
MAKQTICDGRHIICVLWRGHILCVRLNMFEFSTRKSGPGCRRSSHFRAESQVFLGRGWRPPSWLSALKSGRP